LERSAIFQALNKTELEAEKFLIKSAEYFVEKEGSAGNFDLSSREVTEVLHRAEQMFPIEKPGKLGLSIQTFDLRGLNLHIVVNQASNCFLR
jgi:hypothetical protein